MTVRVPGLHVHGEVIVRAAVDGWSDVETIAAFAIGLVLLTAFVFIERRADSPITPLRLFTDRNAIRIGANTKPVLLQTYRRDMGGGQFVLMKDLSSPIFVRGRHWGAFRMGFRHA